MATERDPVDVAARLLQHRERSCSDIASRLAAAGVGKDDREAALEKLERLGWVDDVRFAQSRAESLARRGRGDALIRDDLESSGVSSEVIEATLAGLEPEADRARAIVGERGPGGTTARYLARSGFAEESVEAAVAAAEDAGV